MSESVNDETVDAAASARVFRPASARRMPATRVRVSCHTWERVHCDSCHEDNDSYGFDLLEYEVSDVTFVLCCDVARQLGFVPPDANYVQTCICGGWPGDIEGPRIDCPIHGERAEAVTTVSGPTDAPVCQTCQTPIRDIPGIGWSHEGNYRGERHRPVPVSPALPEPPALCQQIVVDIGRLDDPRPCGESKDATIHRQPILGHRFQPPVPEPVVLPDLEAAREAVWDAINAGGAVAVDVDGVLDAFERAVRAESEARIADLEAQLESRALALMERQSARLANDRDDQRKRAERAEARVKALEDKLGEAWGAIDMALHELGVPTPEYPAPVANAVHILTVIGPFVPVYSQQGGLEQ